MQVGSRQRQVALFNENPILIKRAGKAREHGSRKTIEFREHGKFCKGAGKIQFKKPGAWDPTPDPRHAEPQQTKYGPRSLKFSMVSIII